MFWFLSLLTVCSAAVLPTKKDLQESPVVQHDAGYAYAIELSVPLGVVQSACLKQQGYQSVFVRAYNPTGSGFFDPNSVMSIQNANSAGLGAEVYMTPQPKSSKQGYQQFDEVYSGLSTRGIKVNSIWIQVVSPANWYDTIAPNMAVINSIANRARQYGVQVGIYTSYYEWNMITSGWLNVGNDVKLWYWHVYGGGITGESSANFNDFLSFGSWAVPTVKQFAQTETACSLTVNRNVYLASSAAKMEVTETPVVGFIGL